MEGRIAQGDLDVQQKYPLFGKVTGFGWGVLGLEPSF